jgi:outer membrane lipoprotein-sorting protein
MRANALLATAAGALLTVAALAPLRAAEATPTVDDIIAKHIAARGGKEKFAAVQTARVAGNMTMGPMMAPFTMEWKAPNHMRMEFTVQGQTGVRAYDGTTGWMFMPFMGKAEPEKMAEEDTAGMAQDADFISGPLVDYQAKGHQVRLVGKSEVEGTEAYELEITLKNGDVKHEFLDAESFLTIKEVTKHKQGDQEMEIETAVGNYKEVDGLMLPFSMTSQLKGAPAGAGGQTITVDSYQFGAPIDESRFAFPAKPATAETKPPGR